MSSYKAHRRDIMYGVMILVSLFFVISFVSAVPPVLSTVQTGSLEIIAPTFDVIPQSAKFDFYWHVFNTTNLLNNKTVSCAYHLYSKFNQGEHLYVNNDVTKNAEGRDFEVSINGANFSDTGEYCDLIECNSSQQAGGLERCFIVNTTGLDITLPRTIIGLSMLIFFFVLTIGILVAGIFLPSGNKRDETTGYIIAVSNLKYVKLFLFFFAYVLFIVTTYMIHQVAYSLLGLTIFANFLYIMYTVELIILFPAFIIFVYLLIANWIRDSKVSEMLLSGFRRVK